MKFEIIGRNTITLFNLQGMFRIPYPSSVDYRMQYESLESLEQI